MPTVRKTTEIDKATNAGYSVWGALDEFPYIGRTAPMTARGVIRFVLMRCGWICDECGTRVTVGTFEKHVKYHM